MSDSATSLDVALLSGLVDSLETPVLAVDRDLRIVHANDAAEGWLGRSRVKLGGRLLGAVEPIGALLEGHCRRAIESASVQRGRIDLPGSAVDASISPWWVGGRLEGALVEVRTVVTDAGDAETDLAALSAGLAHEIRNPLAALRGAAELLRHESDETGEYVALILREVGRIDGLVARMMALARPVPLARAPLRLGDLLHELALEAKAFAHAQGVALTVEEAYDPAMPLLPADRTRLFEALANLVKNAVEALPAEGGTVRLSARIDPKRLRRAADGGSVRLAQVTIRDTGPGIGDAGARLFTPFFTTKAKGTGLGLVLARRTVEAHGGRLSLRDLASQGGTGTEAEVLLPIEPID